MLRLTLGATGAVPAWSYAGLGGEPALLGPSALRAGKRTYRGSRGARHAFSSAASPQPSRRRSLGDWTCTIVSPSAAFPSSLRRSGKGAMLTIVPAMRMAARDRRGSEMDVKCSLLEIDGRDLSDAIAGAHSKTDAHREPRDGGWGRQIISIAVPDSAAPLLRRHEPYQVARLRNRSAQLCPSRPATLASVGGERPDALAAPVAYRVRQRLQQASIPGPAGTGPMRLPKAPWRNRAFSRERHPCDPRPLSRQHAAASARILVRNEVREDLPAIGASGRAGRSSTSLCGCTSGAC